MPQSSTPQHTKHAQRLGWLFALAVGLQAIFPWFFHYFPSCDGPSHVHNALQIGRYFHGDPLVREYFFLNPHPESNWFGHLLLMLLIKLAGPNLGEKLLISSYLVLLPFSLRYALRAVRPAADGGYLALAFAALPLSYNWMLHDGFYFTCLSLPALFGAIGWWWPRRVRCDAMTMAGLALWLLLIYFMHVVTLVAAIILFGVLVFSECDRGAKRAMLSAYVVALIPSIILIIWAQWARFGFSAWGDPEVSLVKKGFSLFTLYFGLVSFSKRELLMSTTVALGLWGMALIAFWRGRGEVTQRPWRNAALVMVLIFICAPESLAHGWYLVHRLNIYPFFFLLLLAGTVAWSAKARKIVIVLSLLIACAQLGFYATRYKLLNGYLDEYVSLGAQIMPKSTILALGISNRGHAPDGKPLSERTKPFEFGASRIGIARDCIVLNDYQAHIGNFPLSYRPERDPFTQIGNVLMEPPRFEKGGPISYTTRTLGRVDYIIFWQDRTDKISAAQRGELLGPIGDGYQLVMTSQPRGYARLFRRIEK